MAYIRTGEDNGAKKRPGSANSHLGQAELVVYTDAQNQVPHLGGVAAPTCKVTWTDLAIILPFLEQCTGPH